MEDGCPASNGVSGQAITTTIYHVMYAQINANSTTYYMYTLYHPWHIIVTLSCIPAVKTALGLHVIEDGYLAALD